MDYIDIHCHLDFSDYDQDRGEILKRMQESKVAAITIGTDIETSKKAVEIAEQNKDVWACIGIHPDNAPSAPPLNLREGWGELAASPKVVGIGECGLDYFRLEDERDKIIQKDLFEKQIQFALKHGKPLMLHCRDSYDDVLDILESYKKEAGPAGAGLRGNSHFFAGNIAQAKRFLDIGFSMSFTGVVTFTRDYDEVIRYLPLDSIMTETDAPFVSPVPYRGKRNEPSFVVKVAEKLAEIRGEDPNAFREAVIRNAVRMFGLI